VLCEVAHVFPPFFGAVTAQHTPGPGGCKDFRRLGA
jgi:hypothetical protein